MLKRISRSILAAALLVLPTTLWAVLPTTTPAPTTATASDDYLLHLPGIAGNRSIDRSVTRGIRDGGFAGTIDIYDWTESDPGLDALLARTRNQRESARVAAMLTQEVADHPHGHVDLICHSGGGGIAIWALEALSPGVRIHDVIFMSPAVSPTHDLTNALTHVEDKAYVFTSLADLLVLGTGTRLFGTIDGVKTDAAGRVGFTKPPTADPQQYAKLIQIPYDPSWTRFNDFGDHRGGMTRSFGTNVLAPLLLHDTYPPVSIPLVVQTPTGLGRATTEPSPPSATTNP